jgi:hypothetical protein
MTSIVLVDSGPVLLEVRQEILEFLGHPIIMAQGGTTAKKLDLVCVIAGVGLSADLFLNSQAAGCGVKSAGLTSAPNGIRCFEGARLRQP